MNKKISFPIAIIAIIVLAVLVGGFVVWQYLEMPEEEIKVSEQGKQRDDYKEISVLLNPENDPDLIIEILQQEGDFARGSIGVESGPGAIWIAKEIKGSWKIIGISQGGSFSCELLDQYQVPITIESICHTADGFSEVNRVTGWEIYVNSIYGFKIEYPRNWYVETEKNPPLVGGGTGTPKLSIEFRNYPSRRECYRKEDCEEYKFIVRENFKETYLKKWLKEEQEEYGSIVEEVVIGSEKGYKIISKGGLKDGKQILTAIFFITKGKYLYELWSGSVTDPEFSERENIFDQMLSTFRFLE